MTTTKQFEYMSKLEAWKGVRRTSAEHKNGLSDGAASDYIDSLKELKSSGKLASMKDPVQQPSPLEQPAPPLPEVEYKPQQAGMVKKAVVAGMGVGKAMSNPRDFAQQCRELYQSFELADQLIMDECEKGGYL